MKEKTVVIEIDEQGNTTIDLDGFEGKGCADVAKDFQGHDVVKSSRTKPEFYVQRTQVTGSRSNRETNSNHKVAEVQNEATERRQSWRSRAVYGRV